jgi:predicted flap endonuclease-1-like 5' DNA nuclease
MNASSDTPASKGKLMVAAYRAARLSQRPLLRTNLQHAHNARRLARVGSQPDAASVDRQPSPSPLPMPHEVAAAPTTADPGSVFANLVSTAVAERQSEVVLAESASPEAIHSECTETTCEAGIADPPICPDAPDPPDAVLAAAPPYDPPLAEIGFGPGMLIRLSQLGVHTTADLALADAEQLRLELGDISRLVDVEAWINSARRTASA